MTAGELQLVGNLHTWQQHMDSRKSVVMQLVGELVTPQVNDAVAVSRLTSTAAAVTSECLEQTDNAAAMLRHVFRVPQAD